MANWVNDTGTVVGDADVRGSGAHHGFLWANGTHPEPPTHRQSPVSTAFVVNTGSQIVGRDTNCHGNNLAAVLWEHGSAYDLNRLIGRVPCTWPKRSASTTGRERMPGHTPQRQPARGLACPSQPLRHARDYPRRAARGTGRRQTRTTRRLR
jgi:hypothetical protein